MTDGLAALRAADDVKRQALIPLDPLAVEVVSARAELVGLDDVVPLERRLGRPVDRVEALRRRGRWCGGGHGFSPWSR